MTQKTNQFNLTTNRYTEADLSRFVLEEEFKVICISVSDKFGDNGITGLCILKLNKDQKSAVIDTLLMSCRVIGRNIEYVFLNNIVNILKKENVLEIEAVYKETLKNNQVSDFFDRCGFKLRNKIGTSKNYSNSVKNYEHKDIKYIEVLSEK